VPCVVVVERVHRGSPSLAASRSDFLTVTRPQATAQREPGARSEEPADGAEGRGLDSGAEPPGEGFLKGAWGELLKG
jgi:hypothetical protein